ncbi:MAG: aldehyde:ferredoxin oxidoreductase [Deltaproteobacteria bacterium SG8_13]|nr:MAG: aldehyde:ferredoxin oxidoreductase [Deltaproteobacteria bacterium SG8_13]
MMIVLTVNMTNREIESSPLPDSYYGLGGRALTSRIIHDEVPPLADPLGRENRLVIAPGLLSGTPLVNCGRLSIGAKSPLTGGIKESNVGGSIAEHLGRMGIAAVVVEGSPPEDKQYILQIGDQGGAELIESDDLRGLRTYRLAEKMKKAFSGPHAVLCIGPAGELGVKIASIQATDVDGRPCRAAGRGGLGAVMGSKGIKAIMVDTSQKKSAEPADPKAFQDAAKQFAEAVRAAPFSGKALPSFGTAALMGPVNSIGAFPCYNATQGVFENWEKIGGEALARTISERGGKTRHMGCTRCIIFCSNEYVDLQGRYVTSSLEYETLWAAGGMCGIDDLDTIARIDRLCDDIGVDTISAGTAVAVLMDAGRLRFGDGKRTEQLLGEIVAGTEIGKLIGGGPAAVGKHLGHHRVPVCKGQSIAAYDPRGIQGMAVTYATCPMGADHTAGNLIGESLSGQIDPLSSDGQVEASRNKQVAIAGIDSLGLCLFTAAAASGELLTSLVNARLGTRYTEKNLRDGWKAVLKTEREFNRRAGFTAADDRLPQFFYNEPLPPHNKTVLIEAEEIDRTFDFE